MNPAKLHRRRGICRMYPTLLDTKTGETVIADKYLWDRDFFWWSEGNGSCDCNRSIAMKNGSREELTEKFGDGMCVGCHRIIVIDIHGDLEGMTKAKIITKMNSEYPNMR